MRASIAAAIVAFASTVFADCYQQGSTKLTFYGFPDNDPPSAQTAYNCGGRNYVAGGSGTYSDPLSMASSSDEFTQCEVVYLPILEKYVRYEDYCQQCTDDWQSGQRHIDVWTGSSTESGGQTQIDCEDSLTPDGKITIIRNPSGDLTVDSTPLYQQGTCNTGNVYPGNQASSYCSS